MMTIEATAVETQNYVEELVNVVAKTMVKAFENLTIEDVDMFKLGYSKGISDFTDKFLLELSESVIWGMLIECHKDNSFNDTVDKIVEYVVDVARNTSEQLKGAKQDEDFK